VSRHANRRATATTELDGGAHPHVAIGRWREQLVSNAPPAVVIAEPDERWRTEESNLPSALHAAI
jgi:hypothetical protein